MSAEVSSQDVVVHPAGTHLKPSFRWGYFLLLNAIAAVIAVAIFFALMRGDALDPYMAGTYAWLLAHPMATSLMAFSPLLASLLVGWGYSQRARKRKAAVAEALRISALANAVSQATNERAAAAPIED